MRNTVIAVTGGSGFIGSHLIEELEKENPKKIINIDLLEGYDLTSLTQMNTVLEGVDVVFDLATLPLPLSLKAPYFVTCSIINMAINLCELARQKVFGTLIHVSSSEAYGSAEYTPMNESHPMSVRTPYAAAKASADLIIRSYRNTFRIDTAIARPFNNYGPRQPIELGGIIPATINRLKYKKRPIIYGNGEQMRDFIYVKDTVRGIVEIYKHHATRGKVINLGSGQPITINDLVWQISDLMNSDLVPIYKQERTADVKKHFADIRTADKMLGFKAQIPLSQGLKETIEWYLSHTS